MSIINHKPSAVPPVVVDFGWTFGVHQRLPEIRYLIGVDRYPPGMTTLQAGVTLPTSQIPTSYGSIAELEANFPTQGTFIMDNATIHAVIKYKGLVQISPSVFGFDHCTGGTGAYTVTNPITAIYDPRFYIDSMPMGQSITYDTADNNSLDLPKIQVPAGVSILSYRWDFGNGELGYGPQASVTYPYAIPATTIQCTLTVRDSLNRTFSCAKRLNLRNFQFLWGTGTHISDMHVLTSVAIHAVSARAIAAANATIDSVTIHAVAASATATGRVPTTSIGSVTIHAVAASATATGRVPTTSTGGPLVTSTTLLTPFLTTG